MQIARFASGKLLLENERKPCLPAKLQFREDTVAIVELHEGRYHQVRRMFAACSNHVISLHRQTFGDYTLGDIKEGEYKVLPLPGLAEAQEVQRSSEVHV